MFDNNLLYYRWASASGSASEDAAADANAVAVDDANAAESATTGADARVIIPQSRWLHEVAAFRESMQSLLGDTMTDATLRKSHPIYNFM